MRLSDFLRDRLDVVVRKWASGVQDDAVLRERAGAVLRAIVDDMENPRRDARRPAVHALVRAGESLTMPELVSRLASLRECVLLAWSEVPHDGDQALVDAAQFDAALDRVLTDSVQELGGKLDDSTNRSLAVIGHDLRNSLGAISMAASVLSRSSGLPGELDKPVAGILNTAARMKYMVADLEDLARVRLGRGMPIARAGVDIGTICDKVIKEIQALNPDFSVHFTPSGDLKGDWDGARISQAVGNLVRHAVQYGSFRAPIVVTAEGRPHEVVVSVSNQGLPKPAHPLQSASDPLLQHRPGEADSRDGTTGFRLGLYIAGEIVAAHGGTIDVSSSASEGTRFALHLPRDLR